MKTKNIIKCALLVMLTFGTSCLKDEFEHSDLVVQEGIAASEFIDVEAIQNLEVPKQFDFSTDKEVEILISDETPFARYTIKANDQYVFTGFINNGELVARFKVQTLVTEVTLSRGVQFEQDEVTLSLSGEKLTYEHVSN